MKICVTTSIKYLHLVPVFDYLFKKYWGGEYELYKSDVPANEWSTDLRKYFQQQPSKFIWLMEDTLIRNVHLDALKIACVAADNKNIGRFDLTKDVQKRPGYQLGLLYVADTHSRYRLSTQPSIWDKKFLLQYLTDGLSPWDFETQDPINDGWAVHGLIDYPVSHNEGVRKFDPHSLDLNGFPEEDVLHIKSLL